MTLFPAIKIIAILGVIVGIYFFLEDQLDLSLDLKGAAKDKEEGRRSKYLQSVTGASLEDQLIEVLLMISSSLKAGRNLDQAFELVAVSTPPPICNEFRSLVQERRLGVPMVEALANLAARVPSPDLKLAVNATIFQQETGGNLEDLYRQIVLTVAERKKIMGKVVAGTAHARLSGNLVGSIPLVLAIVITTFHPQYLLPMLQNPYGQIVLILSLTAAIVGLLFINRMTASILPDAEDAMINTNEARARGRSRWKLLRPILAPFAALNTTIPGEWFNKVRLETKFLLEASNKANEFSPEEFIGIMELSAIFFLLLLVIFINPIALGMLGWLVLILLLPIGFRLPRIYLAHLIRKRQKNIEFELPYVIDLLSLAIESGLDLTGGIAKVVEKQRNTDIIVEFKMFLADIKVGKSLEEALADMAERVRVLSFFSFVSSLIQAQRLGAEIGPTLRAQAEQMRYQRMILAEERVNKLPVKLLVPLVFFIFPSISVLLIGPAVLQVQQNFPSISKEEALVSQHSQAPDLSKGILGQNSNGELKKSIILKDSAAPKGEKVQPKKTGKVGSAKKVGTQKKDLPIPASDENDL
jgi:tight adherence protein C